MPADNPTRPAKTDASDVPLCVDCDGTLIASDLLVESALRCVASQPANLLRLPFWLLGGKAALKRTLATRSQIDVAKLPYRPELLAFLRAERERGRKCFLVSAADSTLIEQVAAHLGLFDGTIASDGAHNLKGEAKAQRLVEKFGAAGFDYAGDDPADLPVWKAARKAIAVSASAATLRKLQQSNPPVMIVPRQEVTLKTWLRLMRIHQWAKNLLIFVPVVTSHRLGDLHVLGASALAFLTFGLVGSGTYILNDLADIPHDRSHPSKSKRPIASGEIAPLRALLVSMLLLLGAAAICTQLTPACVIVVAGYLALTTSYTLLFKKKLMVDVVVLAGLYTIRVIAGHTAGGIPYSVWLLAFAIFILFSLALAKRYAELVNPAMREGGRLPGRGYQPGDEVPASNLGTASGVTAILVLVLYINSPEVQRLYRQPLVLLALCPLFLYWIGRIWMLAHRGQLHDDPVIFALRDPKSYYVGALAAVVLILASLA